VYVLEIPAEEAGFGELLDSVCVNSLSEYSIIYGSSDQCDDLLTMEGVTSPSFRYSKGCKSSTSQSVEAQNHMRPTLPLRSILKNPLP